MLRPVMSCEPQQPIEDIVLSFLPRLPKNDRKFLRGILKQYEVQEIYKNPPFFSEDGLVMRDTYYTIVYILRVNHCTKWIFEYELKNLKNY